MRWTDLPSKRPARSVRAWREAWRAHDAVDAIAAHALGPRGDGSPVVALERGVVETARAWLGASRLERGGLLVGEPLARAEDDARIALVHVRVMVPGLDDAATALSLRLEASVWDAARVALREGEVVVGWVHSHPGIGAFFSDTDRRTQAAFFTQPFSLGWVIDPERGEQAWFCGPTSLALRENAVLQIDGHAARPPGTVQAASGDAPRERL